MTFFTQLYPNFLFPVAGIPPWDVLTDAFQQVMNHAASGKLRMETERVRLAKIEDAWDRNVHPAKEGRSIRSVMSVLPPIQKFEADRAATAQSLDCVAFAQACPY